MRDSKDLQRNSLLQEGVSCALATLYVIEAADLFRALPADDAARDQHGHGSWLLAMLTDQLTRLQKLVDALDAPVTSTTAEG